MWRVRVSSRSSGDRFFLVMRAHHADELTLCHHALHQRAKGLIYLDFF
jgi:hypothetical protein